MLGMNLTLQIADGDVVLGEWQAYHGGTRWSARATIRLQAMGI